MNDDEKRRRKKINHEINLVKRTSQREIETHKEEKKKQNQCEYIYILGQIDFA